MNAVAVIGEDGGALSLAGSISLTGDDASCAGIFVSSRSNSSLTVRSLLVAAACSRSLPFSRPRWIIRVMSTRRVLSCAGKSGSGMWRGF
ncbi:hypothetical protein D3C71_1670050 [compost metagenome]